MPLDEAACWKLVSSIEHIEDDAFRIEPHMRATDGPPDDCDIFMQQLAAWSQSGPPNGPLPPHWNGSPGSG